MKDHEVSSLVDADEQRKRLNREYHQNSRKKRTAAKATSHNLADSARKRSERANRTVDEIRDDNEKNRQSMAVHRANRTVDEICNDNLKVLLLEHHSLNWKASNFMNVQAGSAQQARWRSIAQRSGQQEISSTNCSVLSMTMTIWLTTRTDFTLDATNGCRISD